MHLSHPEGMQGLGNSRIYAISRSHSAVG